MKSPHKTNKEIARSWQEYHEAILTITFVRWLIGLAILMIAFVVIASTAAKTIVSSDFTNASILVIQIVGVAVAAIMIVFTIVDLQTRTYRTLRRQNYMRLELESIALFQFDIANTELAAQIWADRPLPDRSDHVAAIRVQQYVSSILNLFEIAVRSRRIDEMPHDAFASWVIWIAELCSRPNFQTIWTERYPDMRWNYISELRQLIDFGVSLHLELGNGSTESAVAADLESASHALVVSFFSFAADMFRCDEIRHWFDESGKQI